jgi:hypothetical protein
MAAKCSEYQETLAIERAMKDKTLSETDWETHQLREQEIDANRRPGAADDDSDAPLSA